ncbi:MAG: helix-turn-helix domain-containing protein [Verrucomicrobiota bacterium]
MKRLAARGDGFAGQHMVVLPEPMRGQARRHALLRGLHVTDAGYFPAAAGHRVERPQGAPTTLVIHCLRGTGWFQCGGRTRPVRAGDLVWLPARQPHAYGAAAGSPWTISWAHFSGDEVPAWREFLRSCGAGDEGLLRLPRDHADEVALDRVHAVLERGLALRWQIAAATALRAALAKVGEILVERSGRRTARERVAASVAALRRDWRRPHRLAELATAAGMSVTHYCAHFRGLTGFAPIDFLIRLRVRQACHLLDTTAMTVGQVAAALGYEDPYYFTRCFRRVMGCAPRDYRKIPKG